LLLNATYLQCIKSTIMKKTVIFLGALAILGTIAFQSCKIEGCTDKKAINFDAKANSDDGSCEYKPGCTDVTAINYDYQAGIDDGSCEFEGQGVFWIRQLSSSDTITVFINGNSIGYITEIFNHPPDCGAEGTVTLITEPGMHGYTAISKTGMHWEDSVYIYKNYCETIELEITK
jgi:hypothetical protein